MRILLVHNEYGKISGEELMVRRIGALLAAEGHEVRFFTRGGEAILTSAHAQAAAFFSGIYSSKSRAQIGAVLDEFQPDIVQVQNLFPNISPSVLPEIRARGIPIVMRCANYRLACPSGLFTRDGRVCEECVTRGEYRCVANNCEGSLPKSIGYALRNFVARRLGFFADNVDLYYAQTDFQRSKLVEAGVPAARIEVIPNMVSGDSIKASPDLGRYVAYAGRVSREKGFPTLMDAARACQGVPFRLAGRVRDGEVPDRPENVEVLGHLEGDAFQRFYADSRMLVLPSEWYEGFPSVIIEAMLHGKPVIASRIGGLPEIVEDGVTGLLFEPGNAEDLADKVEDLWRQPDRCRELGRAGREKALREYSPSRHYERLMGVYQRAMDPGGMPRVATAV